MRENVIEARSITKKYGNVRALVDADITVRRGEIYGLIGDNGAGKTTFLKLLTGQIYLTSGELRLFGKHYEKEMARERKRTGAVIESPGFYASMSVWDNLEYYRIQRGVPGAGKVEEAIKTTGLWDQRRTKCSNLSMGMKQRMGLAIALLGSPELLILDEPINGLDPSGIIEIRNLLLRLNREKNITIILSSHILSELEQTATTYGFLSHGWLLEEISSAKLHEQCTGYIKIRVTEPEKYAAVFDRKMPGEAYQVMPDASIHINNPAKPAECYSALAAEHGIGIIEFEKIQMTLEQYYMNLKERGKLSC